MNPREHVNEAAAKANLAYQTRMYRAQPKESDKVILRLLDGLSGDLLDIGCSNGNLLKHIKARGGFTLHGGDLSPLRVEACRNDPELAGIEFGVMDATELPEAAFDVIVANAVLCLFDRAAYAKAGISLYRALRPGGTLITFDWMHSFNQDVTITEKTDELPEGINLYFRSYRTVRSILGGVGFQDIRFMPFDIPIDLPKVDSAALTTHTVDTDAGRLQFRGVLCQPWCHLVASR